MEPLALFGKSLPELTALMEAAGQKPYRARQVFEALYKQRVASIDEMTTLPSVLREELAAKGWTVGLPEMVQTAKSVDGTERYLMRMADGETVETVWMPDGDGGERGDGSEAAEEEAVGDGVGCRGCGRCEAGIRPRRKSTRISERRRLLVAAGRRARSLELRHARRAGISPGNHLHLRRRWAAPSTASSASRPSWASSRNLTAGEIAGQVAAVLNRHRIQIGKDRINLVFMGMGEPFLNYDEFMRQRAAAGRGHRHSGVAHDRLDLSGILPGIEAFAKEPVRPKLALSLNASNDVGARARDAHYAQVEHRRAARSRSENPAAHPRVGDV